MNFCHYSLAEFLNHFLLELGKTLPFVLRLDLLPLKFHPLLYLRLVFDDLFDGEAACRAVEDLHVPKIDLSLQILQILRKLLQHGGNRITLLHQVKLVEDLGLLLSEQAHSLAVTLMHVAKLGHKDDSFGDLDRVLEGLHYHELLQIVKLGIDILKLANEADRINLI